MNQNAPQPIRYHVPVIRQPMNQVQYVPNTFPFIKQLQPAILYQQQNPVFRQPLQQQPNFNYSLPAYYFQSQNEQYDPANQLPWRQF
uniref:Uncharacterized protein n=1 Tax=Panagrolaimus sp. ES5 TaxID=591445 RepID=A0AC34FQM3_9BILA